MIRRLEFEEGFLSVFFFGCFNYKIFIVYLWRCNLDSFWSFYLIFLELVKSIIYYGFERKYFIYEVIRCFEGFLLVVCF